MMQLVINVYNKVLSVVWKPYSFPLITALLLKALRTVLHKAYRRDVLQTWANEQRGRLATQPQQPPPPPQSPRLLVRQVYLSKICWKVGVWVCLSTSFCQVVRCVNYLDHKFLHYILANTCIHNHLPYLDISHQICMAVMRIHWYSHHNYYL